MGRNSKLEETYICVYQQLMRIYNICGAGKIKMEVGACAY